MVIHVATISICFRVIYICVATLAPVCLAGNALLSTFAKDPVQRARGMNLTLEEDMC